MSSQPITLSFHEFHRSTHNLTFIYKFDEVAFATSMWYPTVNFHYLERRYGKREMERIYCHIFLFHGLKLQSFKPDQIDLGPCAQFWTNKLSRLWKASTIGCLAQWREETSNMEYRGADIIASNSCQFVPLSLISLDAEGPSLLVGNGGGKDSLVMLRMLDHHCIRYHTVSLNFHTEADPARQMDANEKILVGLKKAPIENHRQYIFESFLNSPAAELHGVADHYVPAIRNDEDTPNGHGIFGLLPIMLAWNLTDLCFGNERSADAANVEIDGEKVNHAWSKTIECEKLYHEYVSTELVQNFQCYGLLRQLSDVSIYRILKKHLVTGDLCRAYSCNVRPPWCRRCPKCEYVWHSYLAYLGEESAAEIGVAFGNENPFDVPDLRAIFRQLMGAEGFKPYECVGEIDEVRIALEVCWRRGYRGAVIDDYRLLVPLTPAEFDALWQNYTGIAPGYDRLPPDLASMVSTEHSGLDEVVGESVVS